MATNSLFVLTDLCLLLLATSRGEACVPSNGIATCNQDMGIYNGFTFLTRQEWNAKSWRNDICACNTTDTTKMKPFSKPYVITIHHTALPTQSISTSNSIRKLQQIQSFHQYTRNWCDIAYHFIVDSAGNIFQGRPFWDDNETLVHPLNTTYKWPNPRLIQGAHSLNANTNNIGVAVIGCYDSDPANCPNGTDPIHRFDATYTRLIQILSWICDYYNIQPSEESIVRHSHWKNSTECPGNILGGTQMFADIIYDVQQSYFEGLALCYDYSNGINESTVGGICSNAQTCADDQIIGGNEDQCNKLGQVCCRVSNDVNGDTDSKDWGSLYIVFGIVAFVVVIMLFALAIKKRKENWLQHSVLAIDLKNDRKITMDGDLFISNRLADARKFT